MTVKRFACQSRLAILSAAEHLLRPSHDLDIYLNITRIALASWQQAVMHEAVVLPWVFGNWFIGVLTH